MDSIFILVTDSSLTVEKQRQRFRFWLDLLASRLDLGQEKESAVRRQRLKVSVWYSLRQRGVCVLYGVLVCQRCLRVVLV